jgi:NAD(P)-dependent dehydrogenase (short-subunit alcohol dehydrogenase family)
MSIKDKVVVITGGGGVLGGNFAKSLASQGAKVVVMGRSLVGLENVVASIQQENGIALAVQADVLSKGSLMDAREKINRSFGKCNILINAAGGNHPKGTTSIETFDQAIEGSGQTTFFDLDPEGFQYVFNLNFMGTFLPSQIFAHDMINNDGVIINISSVSSFDPLTKVAAYSAAKAAINNFTKWMAVHFGQAGIRVNALSPGFFIGNQNRSLLLKEDGSLTDRGKKIIDHTPMRRFGKPEDLEGTLLWLCGTGSRFVTGIVVPVDGGFTAFNGV